MLPRRTPISNSRTTKPTLTGDNGTKSRNLEQRNPPSAQELEFGGSTECSAAGAAALGRGGRPAREDRPPKAASWTGAGAGTGGGPSGGGDKAEKAKVKSIKMLDRLEPSELIRVSLPFKEVRCFCVVFLCCVYGGAS